MFYYLLFIIGIILFLISNKNNKYIAFIFIFILFIIASLRYGIGADYFAYEYLFENLEYSFINELLVGLGSQEIGFRIFGSILKGLGIPYQLYISFIALINLYFIYKISKRYSKVPVLSILIYFSLFYIVWTLSGLRQGLTLSIGVYYLLKCVEENKTKKIIIISLLLSFIHTSSIILIPLYFLSKFNYKRNTLIIISISSILISVIPLNMIINLMPDYVVIDRIKPYIDQEINFTLLSIQNLFRIILLAIAIYFYNPLVQNDKFNAKILNIYILSLVSYFIFQFAGELTAARLSIYGRLLEIVIFINIIVIFKKNVQKIIYSSILFLACFLMLNKEMNTMERQAGLIKDTYNIPYTNIFQNKEDDFDKSIFYLLERNKIEE